MKVPRFMMMLSLFFGWMVIPEDEHHDDMRSRTLFMLAKAKSRVSPVQYNVVSSAYISMVPSSLAHSGKSLQNKEKRLGPNTEPWGTPKDKCVTWNDMERVTFQSF